ncbi:MAG: isocitrate/isopropylmalate dehydrogenase family protein [Deltaproteobacteria bacterium]|nr:MAG: isocitrate/isopropylmalate dehydrogenase family protein [Deltaproteobacteria bacterium]
MSKPTIVTMPGDGIGKTVLAQAKRVLGAVGFEARYVEAEIGWEAFAKGGEPLPQRTIDLLTEHGVGLLGPVTTRRRHEGLTALESQPSEGEASAAGPGYCYPTIELRQRLNLQVRVRPCRTFAGNPLNFIRRTSDESFEEPPIDVVVFRQSTEGLYSGVEWTNPPTAVREALETHEKMAAFAEVPSEELVIACRICAKQACRYVCEKAFAHAKEHGYQSVTLCDMPLVIRQSAGMLEQAARDVATDYPDIPLRLTDIDTQMMWLTHNPEDQGVIIAGSTFGDIVSDGFVGLVGGQGFTAAANLGPDCAIFEPSHGPNPTLGSQEPSMANPIAMILAACLMLDHLGEGELATRIRSAIAEVVEEGKVRTYDMLKLRGRPEELSQGAVSCDEMTDAIIDRLWPGAA